MDAQDDPTSPTDDLASTVRKPNNVLFEASRKHDGYEALDSRIIRLFYINAYGSEIHPSPNPDYLHNLGRKDVLIYSCGSLWTRCVVIRLRVRLGVTNFMGSFSIVPCLALRGVAGAIARSRSLRAKVLLCKPCTLLLLVQRCDA